MELASSTGSGIPEAPLDLSFGFNDPKFSDRTLLLQIAAHSDEGRSHRLQNMKRHCCNDLHANTSTDTTSSPQPRLVKTVHISSLILASRSPFFHKIFSNGMQESEQKQVTLHIEALEEVSFMDLLKYVYSNNLPTTFDALLDLSLTADKFEVDSCSKGCIRALQNMPMTCELALVYLDLPSCLLTSPVLQPLIEAAKKYLAANFNDLSKFEEELLNLPLPGLQAVLSSDGLLVFSEVKVYDFVLKWVHKHYPKLEERREILKTHLLYLVRFPFMTTTQLIEKVLTCSDIDPGIASKIVIRALSFKAETDSHRKLCLAAEEGYTTSCQFVERAYIYRPVKVVGLELPHPQCVVYLDLTWNELKRIFPHGNICSEDFHLDGRELYLCVSCSKGVQSDQHIFVLSLHVSESASCIVDYEFSVRKTTHEGFEQLFRGSRVFTKTDDCQRLHAEEWAPFIDHDSSYFINDILHMRAEITIKKLLEISPFQSQDNSMFSI